MGNSLKDLNNNTDAIIYYDKVLKINPTHNQALSHKLFQLANICDWNEIAKYKSNIKTIGLSNNEVEPFTMFTFDDSLSRNQKRAEFYVKMRFQNIKKANFKKKIKNSKLKLGFFSAKFFNHANMYLISRVLELLDKNKFEIYGYSFGPNTEDEMHLKCKNLFKSFIDIKNLSDNEVIKIVKKENIDIAIDLMGYAKNSRPSLFFLKLAPIQINYLGYPGTMGSGIFDYIIADRVIIPERHRKYYNEEVIYLPNTYQATNNIRKISKRIFSKKECGLPSNSFVFCCFNNNYKITNVEFSIWMRLLKQVSGSVLWLLKKNKSVQFNIENQAKKFGINPNRIIFAEFAEISEHLSRHSCADLFLDTFNVNAHTTASDALWAGLPVLTKIGNSFASRVSASLLKAINIPELITKKNKEYEQLAIELALDKIKLKKIKDKLKYNIPSSHLFNSEQYTKDFENILLDIYKKYINI